MAANVSVLRRILDYKNTQTTYEKVHFIHLCNALKIIRFRYINCCTYNVLVYYCCRNVGPVQKILLIHGIYVTGVRDEFILISKATR